MSMSIEGSRSQRTMASAPAAESKPVSTATTVASQAPVATSPASNGGASAAPTTYIQARTEPTGPSSQLVVPTSLSRVPRSGEDGPQDTKATSEQIFSGGTQSYPIKPQAEGPLKELNDNFRVKNNNAVQHELGRFVNSPVFKELDGKAQVQALELFKANLPNPGGLPGAGIMGGVVGTTGLERAREVLDALKTYSPVSEHGIGDVLQGLTKASPLSANTAEKTKELVQSSGFKRLSAVDKQVIASGLNENKCNPKFTEGIKDILEHPTFKARTPKERTELLKLANELPAVVKF